MDSPKQNFRRLVAFLFVACAVFAATAVHMHTNPREAHQVHPNIRQSQESIEEPPKLARAMSGAVALVATSPQVLVVQALVLKHPIVLELGAVILCQTVALPIIGKLSVVLRHFDHSRRMALIQRHIHLSASAIRTSAEAMRRISFAALRSSRMLARKSARTWGLMATYYKKTAASKYVNRGKRVIKEIQHFDDDEGHHY